MKEGGLINAGVLFQYDYGQRMIFTAEQALPSAYEVHFSNTESEGFGIAMIGDENGVDIPDALLLTGDAVWFWVYLHTGADDGETVYRGRIWVIRRAEAEHEEPTPVQQSEIEQLVNALNRAVEQSEANVEHYPVIQDGMWMIWDAALEEFVSTGISATGPKGDKGEPGDKGDTGNGINSTVLNPDYTLTITFTDGTTYTTPPIRGEKGDPGEESVMVATQVTENQYRLGLGRE